MQEKEKVYQVQNFCDAVIETYKKKKSKAEEKERRSFFSKGQNVFGFQAEKARVERGKKCFSKKSLARRKKGGRRRY